MGEIKYGLISETDARCLEKTIDEIWMGFPAEDINITEIGIFDGQTARGLYQYATSKVWATDEENIDIGCNYTAIDNNKDKEVLIPFPECKMIVGNSDEVHNQIEYNSQHLIFIDACHCLHHVQKDFICYNSKVKVSGYIAFHDTGEHIKPFTDYQHGDKDNPDNYISVRKALNYLELLSNYSLPKAEVSSQRGKWELIYDEADITDPCGGVTVFKKIA